MSSTGDNGVDAECNDEIKDQHEQSLKKESAESKSQNTEHENSETVSSGIKLVKSGNQVYTKITNTSHIPLHQQTTTAQPKEYNQGKILNAQQVQDNRNKRLKEDPNLKHLQLQNRSTKAPLFRSTSMPVCVDESSEFTENEKSHPEEGKINSITQHRKIFRTGSVSDYTKQRLKTSILMKTSASLVRKPSITDFEMRQIQGEDADSSQSDDDDEDDDGGRFKPVTTNTDDTSTTALSVSDSSCRKDILTVTTSPLVVSSLPESSVSLAIAITSA
ncbi:uncharacterized protein LOC120343564 [Styela clava]